MANKRHEWVRWAQLISGILLVVIGFGLIFFENALPDIPIHLFIVGAGGAYLGSAIQDWHGNKELKLLKEAIQKICDE